MLFTQNMNHIVTVVMDFVYLVEVLALGVLTYLAYRKKDEFSRIEPMPLCNGSPESNAVATGVKTTEI